MTNFMLPAILAIVGLAYIFMPFYAGVSQHRVRRVNYVPGLEEIDLDHDLGKIDDDEWNQRRAQAEQAARATQAPPSNVERLIWNFRRSRRAEIAVEAEILIARNRKDKKANS